jgi:tetratricopeptide (TPR) repeat protein
MVGVACSTTGLLLTQSKGGFLVLGIGLACVIGLILLWKGSPKSLAAPALGLFLGALIFAGLQFAPRPGAPAGASGPGLTRITGAGGEAEQSAGFRTLLWKSSLDLASERPWGWGPGVFRFVSAKPGLVTQTVTAHQTWLQVLVEGGILALLSFIGLAVVWLGRMFPGAKHLTEQQNTLRAGVVAGVVAAGAHGFIESSLSYAGVGVIVFALLGVSLQLAADGSAPEVMPKAVRQIAALLCCVVPLFLLVIAARSEAAKGAVLLAAQTQSPSIREGAQGLRAMAAGDGEASYLAALYGSASPEERLRDLREAAKTYPSTKTLRQLARAEDAAGRPIEASTALSQALRLDPNNLPAHWLKFEMLARSGELTQAEEAAREMLKVENSPAFKVRSLPEAVPTETYRVRLFLADQVDSPDDQVRLIKEALEGLASFARLTVPQIIRFEAGGATYAGVTSAEAKEWLTEIKTAAASLPSSEEVEKNRQSVDEALAALESA